MRIAMIGSGYVGLVSGACFAQFGHDVVCVDKDAGKIDRLRKGEMPIYEPGLDELVADNVEAGRLAFTHRSRRGGGRRRRGVHRGRHADPARRRPCRPDLCLCRRRRDRRRDPRLHRGRHQVDGAGRHRPRSGAHHPRDPARGAEFDVASNPEFLREGAAIEDFMKPDRVVIGAESERARDVMSALYRPLYLIQTPMVFTNIETAEVTKYAGNAFLATKITFINEIADLCEKVGADVHDVARGIGLDGRIGRKFLHPGPGFGGSCFPKDTLALAHTAREANAPQTHRRAGHRGQRHAQEEDGQEGHRLLRRLGRRPDDRRARPHLQAQHRRHARRAVPRHRAGAAGGRARRSSPSIPKA